MPRPKRNKVTPSAPAQLPDSLMKAIRADKESKERDEHNKFGRRTSARMASKSQPQEVFMSGALGVRAGDSQLSAAIDTNNARPTVVLDASLDIEDQELVPSSIQSEEAKLAKIPSPNRPPSTVQRPIPQRSTMPSANWRTQATPRLDSSAIGNFKRRPRQPSILGIGRQDESSIMSSVGDIDDSIFRDLEDEEPAAILILSNPPKAMPHTEADTHVVSNSPPTLNVRKRKRGSDDGRQVLVRRTPSMTVDDGDVFVGSSPERSQQESDEVSLPPPHKAVTNTSRTSNTSPPTPWSDTMAPPQSSPSDAGPEQKIPIPTPKKQQRPKRKKPSPAKQSIPQTRSKKSRALQPISTAPLQTLLPSRKPKQKSKLDESLNSTTADSGDEDEASFVPSRRVRAASKQPKTPARKPAPTRPVPKSAKTLRDKTNSKANNIPGSVLRKSTAKPTKVYSRSKRVASGQENADVYTLSSTQDQQADADSSSLSELSSPVKDSELVAIAKKFAEVDEWEMEFEEADNSSGGGSGLLLV